MFTTSIERRYMEEMQSVKRAYDSGVLTADEAGRKIQNLEAEAYEKYPDQVEPDGDVTYTAAMIMKEIEVNEG